MLVACRGAYLIRSLGDDGFDCFFQGRTGFFPQIAGGGVIPAVEYLACIIQGHVAHGFLDDIQGLGDGGLGSAVHGGFEFVHHGALAGHAQAGSDLVHRRRQWDAHLGVIQKSTRLAQVIDGALSADAESFFQSGADLSLAEP